MTGDLIDFVKIANNNNLYKNNFFVFIEILLGLNRGLDENPEFTEREHINIQEILVPIFTIAGNHDYRKGHYSLNIFHRIFGLTHRDIKGYKDDKIFNGLKALYSKVRFLYDYFLFINPNRNFRFNIGLKYSFIFSTFSRPFWVLTFLLIFLLKKILPFLLTSISFFLEKWSVSEKTDCSQAKKSSKRIRL